MISCYCVTLRTTSSMRDTARVNGVYIPVEHGELFFCAETMRDVGVVFPDALKIERVGIAFWPGQKTDEPAFDAEAAFEQRKPDAAPNATPSLSGVEPDTTPSLSDDDIPF